MTRYSDRAAAAGVLLAVVSTLRFVTAADALDREPKQVAIETKIVEASRLPESVVFFVPLEHRDAKAELAIAVSRLPDNKTKIEVSSLVTGGGADFRRWEPNNPHLLLLEPKATLLPEIVEKIQVAKPSAASPAAPFLFAALGSQYEGAGAHATASPGTPCSSGGASGERSSGVHNAIDRAGMAAGLGLLTSQAKGQITGQRSVFLTDVPVLKFMFKTEAKLKEKNQLIVFTTPTLVMPGADP